ncbi:MAG TPA: hypothetical protein VFW21_06695 [Mycobacterium sp.]|nr:hypothetical protein [Mycobacterium sp.]
MFDHHDESEPPALDLDDWAASGSSTAAAGSPPIMTLSCNRIGLVANPPRSGFYNWFRRR